MLGLSLNSTASTASYAVAIGGRTSTPAAETQNYSVYLDGASDRIQGANLSTTWLKVVDANAEFSLHFSLKLDALNSSISFSGTSSDYLWILVNSGGDLQFSFARTSPNRNGSETWDTNFSTGTWYDIVITGTNDTNRDLKCYVNKVEQTSSAAVLWPASEDNKATPGKFTMGTFLNAVDYDFRVDRLASWSSVITSAEVTEIYDNYPDLTADSGNYVSSDDLETYYKIEEGSGTTMADSSGNSNASLSVVNASGNLWSSDTRI